MADIDHMDSDFESDDSEKELQAAFETGLLKTGLNHVARKVEYINNIDGLKQAYEDMKSDLPWVERLDLTVAPLPPPKPMMDQLGANPDDLAGEDVHDDFKREMKFYRLAQAACIEGVKRLKSMGLPTKRPDDYFAEMAKSDDHMKKVRQKLLSKQMATERSEKAKKMRELRKYGKKVQQEVLQKRQKEKKEMLESVKKYRKGEQSKLSFLDDKPKGDPQRRGGKEMPVNKKREFKNKKFGFGGQKKRSKYNTKKSFGETSDFSVKKHSTAPGKGKNVQKGGNKNRPGKARRQKAKSKKR